MGFYRCHYRPSRADLAQFGRSSSCQLEADTRGDVLGYTKRGGDLGRFPDC